MEQEKIINKIFLLNLINSADYVYLSCQENKYFYFYAKEIDFKIKVPFGYSDEVDVYFFKENKVKNINKNVILSLGKNCFDFLNKLHKKYELMLNSNMTDCGKFSNLIEEDLLLPVKKTKFYLGENNGNIALLKKEDQINLSIHIENIKKEYFLYEPIVLNCKYNNIFFKKVIPAYNINNYPIFRKMIKIKSIHNNISSFIEEISKIEPKCGIILKAKLLDIELNNKEQNKTKIKIKI